MDAKKYETTRMVDDLKHASYVPIKEKQFDSHKEIDEVSGANRELCDRTKKCEFDNSMTVDENANEVSTLGDKVSAENKCDVEVDETVPIDDIESNTSVQLSEESLILIRKGVLDLLQAEQDMQPKEIYDCIICGQDFSTMEELSSHLKTNHLSMDDFKINKKQFLNASLRLQPAENTLLECLLCRKKFSNKRSLSSHLTVYHFSPQIQKVHECQFCGKVFKFHSRLIRHYNVHTQEKKYNCSVCGKGFGCESNMAQHERKHFPENHFECDVCGKTLTAKEGLITDAYAYTYRRETLRM